MNKHNDANIFVIDIGSSNTSWGYAGDDDPRQCRTSAFNWDESKDDLKWSQHPSQFLELREGVIPMRLLEYRNLPGILQRFAKLTDSDADQSAMTDDIKPPPREPSLLSVLSKKTAHEELRYINELIPSENLKDKLVLFSEPTKKSSSNIYSKTLGEVSIESMEVEAFFSVRKATLSSFALGRPTALVTETGPLGTTITPVFEGYTLKNHIQQYAVGGCLMDWLLATSLQLWDPYRSVFADSFWPFGLETRKAATPASSSRVTPLYLHSARRRVLEDMTQSSLVIRESASANVPSSKGGPAAGWPGANRRSGSNEMMDNDEDADQMDYNYNHLADIPYELPDGKAVHIPKSVAADVTEFIFEPWTTTAESRGGEEIAGKNAVVSLLSPFEAELSPLIRNWPGLARALVSTAFTCDVDILPTLMSNIVVGGGPSAMEGYLERVASSLSELSHLDVSYRDRCPWAAAVAAPNMSMLRDVSQLKVKVAAQSPFDRRFTTWVGGSILASLSSFDSFWITRKEWSEYGPNILYKKLVF